MCFLGQTISGAWWWLEGKQHCSLPSGVASRRLPQGAPSLQTQAMGALYALWLKAKFVVKGSGQLLLTQSKHLWHIIYACTTPTRLPPTQETLCLREMVKQVHHDPSTCRSVPSYWEDTHCSLWAIHNSRKLYFIPKPCKDIKGVFNANNRVANLHTLLLLNFALRTDIYVVGHDVSSFMHLIKDFLWDLWYVS